MPELRRELAMTSSQAAGYLGVSQETIRRWCNAGHLDHYRTPGGQLRFSREGLQVFAASLRNAEHRNGSVGSVG